MKAQILFKPYKFGSELRELEPKVCLAKRCKFYASQSTLSKEKSSLSFWVKEA